MDEIEDPGTLRNDPLAAERARTAISELAYDVDEDREGNLIGADGSAVAAEFADRHIVTWERDVNAAGVAVRRYVARSAWEVDPEPTPPADRSPVTAVLRQVLDEIHGADEFGAHGAILRRDAEAIVRVVADNAGVVL